LECLNYACAHGCPWSESTCYRAAANGHLECLKYACAHGCPWSEWTCEYAAFFGHLECLKYARENGCPWDEETCYRAAANGHLECLKYACAHGCPGSDRYAEALKAVEDADERFGVEVALAIHRNGGEISVQEFLPLWRERRDAYDAAHFEATRESTAELL